MHSKNIFAGLALASSLAVGTVWAADVPAVISAADGKYNAALDALKQGQFDDAQTLFDDAVMEVFGSGVDLETNAELGQYLDDLKTRIVDRQAEARAASQAGLEAFTPPGALLLDGPVDLLDSLLSISPAEIGNIANEINFPINTNDSLVTKMVNFYGKGGGKPTTRVALKRAWADRPGGSLYEVATAQFAKQGVPTDLVWLAFAESRWATSLTSSVGCCFGLFQVSPAAAKEVGMNGSAASLFNPTHNSIAAAKYLKRLHNVYGFDWARAIGAYNWGPGNMKKWSKKLGTTNFWVIAHSGRMPKETVQYTPQLIAAIHIAKNAGTYGVAP
jgi:membrane-bound lytic murein transglycosylase D